MSEKVRFIVKRTSSRDEETPPCDGAVLEMFPVTPCGIQRRKPDDVMCWAVHMEPADILDFVRRYGECIVSKSPYHDGSFEIEIYDDYRE